MLDPSNNEWRRRVDPTGAGVTRPLAETADADESPSVPSTAATRHDCPVCEFASEDYDDVYAHLLTAHRKSTISAALLRNRPERLKPS